MKIAKPYCLFSMIFLLITPLFSCGGGGNSAGGGGDPTISVTISPTTPTVGISETITFKAAVSGGTDPNVFWSVKENSAGGKINQNGTYTTPDTTGTYHVIATSQADTTRSAMATVTVVLIP